MAACRLLLGGKSVPGALAINQPALGKSAYRRTREQRRYIR